MMVASAIWICLCVLGESFNFGFGLCQRDFNINHSYAVNSAVTLENITSISLSRSQPIQHGIGLVRSFLILFGHLGIIFFQFLTSYLTTWLSG